MTTVCSGPAMALGSARHDLVGGDNWECKRCKFRGGAGHRDAASRSGCLVPLVQADGWEDEGTWKHWRLQLGFAAAFRDRCCKRGSGAEGGTSSGSPGDEEVGPVAEAPVRRLQGYRDHRPVEAGATPVCISCGQQPKRKEETKKWMQRPCGGKVAISEISWSRRFWLGVAWRARPTGSYPEAWVSRLGAIAQSVSVALASVQFDVRAAVLN